MKVDKITKIKIGILLLLVVFLGYPFIIYSYPVYLSLLGNYIYSVLVGINEFFAVLLSFLVFVAICYGVIVTPSAMYIKHLVNMCSANEPTNSDN